MAERILTQTLAQLRASGPATSYPDSIKLISRAKAQLHALHALTPTQQTPRQILPLAREVYEIAALLAIRAIGHFSAPAAPAASAAAAAKSASAEQHKVRETTDRARADFVRNVQQLQPFYDISPSVLPPAAASERNKVTGLYLLFLLTDGRYAEFHSELETLTMREEGSGWAVEGDKFLAYPVRLERWLMEGSYDRVWKAMKSREVPCEEYGVFSEVLTKQIRSEIASSSERAYPKLPLSSTKSLLFLESEGQVIEFARQRGWLVKDGQIFFPDSYAVGEADDGGDVGERETSKMVIENTLGYARELETIV